MRSSKAEEAFGQVVVHTGNRYTQAFPKRMCHVLWTIKDCLICKQGYLWALATRTSGILANPHCDSYWLVTMCIYIAPSAHPDLRLPSLSPHPIHHLKAFTVSCPSWCKTARCNRCLALHTTGFSNVRAKTYRHRNGAICALIKWFCFIQYHKMFVVIITLVVVYS
jgi:hypothetical protein